MKGILVPHWTIMRDPRIMPIAWEIKKQSVDRDDFVTKTFHFVLSNVKWVDDRNNQGQYEFVQTPMETLKRGVGDCEDSAILMLSILWYGGVLESREALGYAGFSHRWVEAETSTGWEVFDTTNGRRFLVSDSPSRGYEAYWFINPISIRPAMFPLPPLPLFI